MVIFISILKTNLLVLLTILFTTIKSFINNKTNSNSSGDNKNFKKLAKFK